MNPVRKTLIVPLLATCYSPAAFADDYTQPVTISNGATVTGTYTVNLSDGNTALYQFDQDGTDVSLNALNADVVLDASGIPFQDLGSEISIVSQYAFGAQPSDPNPAPPSGAIKTQFNNVTMNFSYTGGNDVSVYGLNASAVGGHGGTSRHHGTNGGHGGETGRVAATITETKVNLSTKNVRGGAAVYFAQQGGKGGNGNPHATAGNGGSGGNPDQGISVMMEGSTLDATSGHGVAGLVVVQWGGAGGGSINTGMAAEGLSVGGGGGDTHGIDVTLQESGGVGNEISTHGDGINTNGDNAAAILLRSVAGDGARGGNRGGGLSGDDAAGDGGRGGNAGLNSTITGNNPANINLMSSGKLIITTTGSTSVGIHAMSVGGNGGDGGNVQDFTDGTAGKAGPGGWTSGIQLALQGGATITTAGANSSAILAYSAGGNGGVSGGSDGNLSDSTTFDGGSGGAAGTVTVSLDNMTNLSTSGESSDGITAQSVGGLGGNAGDATGGGGSASAGNGGAGGLSGGIDVDSAATITTTGTTARGIFAQAISGIGGTGGGATGLFPTDGGGPGIGGAVQSITVNQSGSIMTSGDYSQGVLAQSISGGGGAGGSASGSIFHDDGGGTATANSNGGDIQLDHSGSIQTSGESAQAIVAQSIGGGGGSGGTAGGMIVANAGDGGLGGDGGTVGFSLAGKLSTSGTTAHGVVAQSIGGGGGTGGNAHGTGIVATTAIGGTGGTGGKGGAVTVDATGLDVTTVGTGSIGLAAQSVGGGGGAGGAAYAISAFGVLDYAVAVGGNGGNGGNGGGSAVTLSGSSIQTGPLQSAGNSDVVVVVDAIGVSVQSIGGGGGIGGGASANAYAISLPVPTEEGIEGTPTLSISAAVGGAGGEGGSGGDASLALHDGTQISTWGVGSHGVQVQSIGGGGGQGGDSSAMAASVGYGGAIAKEKLLKKSTSVNLSLAVGGNCVGDDCRGGNGGDATLWIGNDATTPSTITTNDSQAIGASVQSIGGGGGNAGIGSASASSYGATAATGVSIDVGLKGGAGGDGGSANATIQTDGKITTNGFSATGLLVQSIGGGGGVGAGGGVDVSGIRPWLNKIQAIKDLPAMNLSVKAHVGAKGGKGGHGGTVTVSHYGQTIETKGKDAAGIIAQSIGGGGGIGGSAGTPPPLPSGGSSTSAMATTGRTAVGASVPLPVINITPILSIGGYGGSGGEGGSVIVNLSGSITTSGDYSPAVLAQSIGGGGGVGGVAVTGGSPTSFKSIAQLKINSSLTLGVNGHGGGGGNGGSVKLNVNNDSPNLNTSGFHAIGILAQSIGGGGGSGYDGSDAASGNVALGITTSESGGAAGNGGNVSYTGTPDSFRGVGTSGDAAHGIVLQSVGGGGGVAAKGSTTTSDDWTANFTFGGNSGGAGNGGKVSANFGPQTYISTKGNGAVGLVAQSIGGGGGMAAGTKGLNATVDKFGSSNSSTSSDSSSVSITTSGTSAINTSGIGGHGIVAQSIGGGGGMFIQYTTGSTPQLTGKFNGSPTAGFGTGGDVTVDISSDITTTGAGAFGIVAQSIAGGGGMIANNGTVFIGHTGTDTRSIAGEVNVTVEPNTAISASGTNSIGVLAQSSGSGGTGPITIEVWGSVAGGSGDQGAGIVVAGGNASNQINIHDDTWVWAQSENAIVATGKKDVQKVNVQNDGQIYGNTWLKGGSINGNYQHTTGVPPGKSAGTLTNAGMLIPTPGKRSYIDGHLIQTSTGKIVPHMDYTNGRSGHYEVTGNAVLDGSIQPTFASALPNIFLPVLTVNGSTTGTLDAPDGPLFSYTLRNRGNEHHIAITGTHFDDSRFGLTSHKTGLARSLEKVFAAGKPELGIMFGGLDAVARAGKENYRNAIAELSPRSAMTLFAQTAANASQIADASMSCPEFATDGTQGKSFLTEGECSYFMTRGYHHSLSGDADRGRAHINSVALQTGFQREIRPDTYLGGSIAYQTDRFSGRDGVSADGSSVQGAVTLKHQTGPWLLTGAVFGSYGEFDLTRRISLPGFTMTADGDVAFSTIGARARAAYTVGTERFYLRPYLNLDLVHAQNGSFEEGGAGDLGLHVDRGSYTSAILTPAVELGGRHEFSDGRVLRAFASAGVSARSNTEWEGRASFTGSARQHGFDMNTAIDKFVGRIGAGVQFFQSEQADVRLQYDGEFGAETKSHGVKASFNYRF